MKKDFLDRMSDLNKLHFDIIKKQQELNSLSFTLLKDILSEQNELKLPIDKINREIGYVIYDKMNTAIFHVFTGFKKIGEKLFICGYSDDLYQTYKSSFDDPCPISYLGTTELTEIFISLNLEDFSPKKRKTYTTFEEIIEDTIKGKTVFWKNSLYCVKLFSDTVLVYCPSTNCCGGELRKYEISDFFTYI